MRIKILENIHAGISPVGSGTGLDNYFRKGEIVEGERLDKILNTVPLDDLVSEKLVEVLSDNNNLELETEAEKKSKKKK